MTETLDPQSRRDLVNYRLGRASATLKEADYIAAGGYYNAAMNRLYYACFYAASALMLQYGFDASTHKGIRNMLGQKFIQTGLLPAKYGRIYSQLFQNRQAGDYEDFVYCDRDLFELSRPDAEEFVSVITSMVVSED